MPAPIRSSNLVIDSNVAPASLGGATINGVAAGNTLVAIVVAGYPAGVDTDLVSGYGTTVGGTPNNTWTNVLRRRLGETGGTWYVEVTAWIASSVAAGDTVGKPTVPLSGNYWIYQHMDEWTGIMSASPVDQTATASALTGSSLTVGPTGALAVASQTVIAAIGSRYNFVWNGDFSDPGTPPATYTTVRGTRDNVPGIVGQTVYKDVTSTTAVSASWTYATDEPVVAGLFTLKQGSTALRLEIDDIKPDIAGTTGWTFWAWSGNPAAAPAAKEWTAYSASVVGGKLVFPDAPTGATAGSTWNVYGYQPSGTLSIPMSTGVVRAV